MKNSKRLSLRNILIAGHIFFAIFGLYVYLVNYTLTENLLVQKTLSKQLTIAKAGSLSIENLLNDAQHELDSFIFSFAKINESSPIDIANTRAGFISYMRSVQLPVNGIAYYDEKGKLIVIENRTDIRTGENQDFSKADFIKWSALPANKDKVYVSTPVIGTTGASVGKIILIVAKPIYFGKTYKGTLGIRILVDDLRKAFIDPLVSDATEDSFIVDKNGVLVAGRTPLLNKNLFSYAKDKKWNQYQDFTVKLSAAIKTTDTQTAWIFQNPKENPKTFLVGISKIDVPNTDKDLYMVVATPKDNVVSPLSLLKTYGYVWLGLGVLATTLGGIIIILITRF